jgi:uncharacterized protein
MKKIFIAKTKQIGKGIFAGKIFKRGEYIFTAKGKIVKAVIKNKTDSKKWKCERCIGISKTKWLDPDKDNPLYYTNHSCNPNMGIKGNRKFFALRDIKENEELTFDYSATEGDIYWTFHCNCGHSKCRKVIKSIHSLPKNLYKNYLPFIPTYFKKVYTYKK